MEEHPVGKVRTVDLAKRLSDETNEEFSESRVGNWVRGERNPPPHLISKIADILDVNEDWILGENVPMRDPTKPNRKQVFRAGVRWIPVYGAITAGAPASNQGDVVEWFEMREWGGDFERWGRVVEGFSMEPELHPGDFAIFENRRWEPGNVVHAYNDGEDTVKVAKVVGGVLRLYPTNPDYEPIDAKSWHVKGVCIATFRRESNGETILREFSHGLRPKLPERFF